MPRRLVIAAFSGTLLAALMLLGYRVSPFTADERPLLLSPTTRAVERYRRDAVQWQRVMGWIDMRLEELLQDEKGEPFVQSERGQHIFASALELAREIDRTGAPPILADSREQLSATANAYLEGVRLAMRWISAPTDERRTAAVDGLKHARALRSELSVNE